MSSPRATTGALPLAPLGLFALFAGTGIALVTRTQLTCRPQNPLRRRLQSHEYDSVINLIVLKHDHGLIVGSIADDGGDAAGPRLEIVPKTK